MAGLQRGGRGEVECEREARRERDESAIVGRSSGTPAMTLLFSSFRRVNCEMSGCQNYLFRIAQLLNTDTDRLLLKRLRIKLV